MLFLGDRLSGLIDFYFACDDAFAYDLAISFNAWCFDAVGVYDEGKGRALIDAYRRVRPLSARELAAFPLLARGAALRFLLTRFVDALNVPPGALVLNIKNLPAEIAHWGPGVVISAKGEGSRAQATVHFDSVGQKNLLLSAALVRPKDPREYLTKLRFHQSIATARNYGVDA